VPLKRSLSVLPVGVAMGIAVMLMAFVSAMPLVYLLLVVVGALAGFFVVPMNALLQHRGHVLLSAGHSIAVQNLNENVSILVMLALYSGMLASNLSVHAIVIIFGMFVSATMLLVMRRHQSNQSKEDSLHLIGIEKP